MRISDLQLTPLHYPFKQPYHWSKGVTYGAPAVPIEAETDASISGIGECSASPAHAPILTILKDSRPSLVPRDGALPISALPGLGFELNPDAVKRAAVAYKKL